MSVCMTKSIRNGWLWPSMSHRKKCVPWAHALSLQAIIIPPAHVLAPQPWRAERSTSSRNSALVSHPFSPQDTLDTICTRYHQAFQLLRRTNRISLRRQYLSTCFFLVYFCLACSLISMVRILPDLHCQQLPFPSEHGDQSLKLSCSTISTAHTSPTSPTSNRY